MNDLIISIVSMNNKEYLKKCLDSIYKNLAGSLKVKIVVVINNSTDGTLEMMREFYTSAIIIFVKKRLGFAQCHNLAFAENPDGRYFLILNDDTEIIGDCIEKMVECMDRNKKIGALGCKVLSPDTKPQGSFGAYPSLIGLLFEFCSILKIFNNTRFFSNYNGVGIDYNTSRELTHNALWGCCFMVSREAVEEVGFLDATFSPAYLEETDWCMRIKNAGFQIYFLAEAEIFHHFGKTMEKVDEALSQELTLSLQVNRYYFFRKHKGIFQEIIVRVFDLCRNLVFSLCLLGLSVFGTDRGKYWNKFIFYKKLLAASFAVVPPLEGKILTLAQCRV